MMPTNHVSSFSGKIKSKLSETWYYTDFCKREFTELTNYIKMVISDCKNNNNYNYVPVVMIGHSKDFFFANNLSMFLYACQNIEEVEFTTYSGAVKKIITESNQKSITIK
jgi:hypothetical protein